MITVLIVLGIWTLGAVTGCIVWCLCHGPRTCEGCGRVLVEIDQDLCTRCRLTWRGGAA
jgi:hypothetical protein